MAEHTQHDTVDGGSEEAPDPGVVSVERDGPVLRVTITRPEARNAVNADVNRGLLAAIETARQADDLAAVVLTGAGDRAFCAGGDLGGLDLGAGEAAVHRGRALFAEVLEGLRRLPRPVIGRVNGHALAGGFGLALACDVLVAADSATFGTTEVKVGLWPYMISTLISDHLGPKKAMELMLTGRRISAEEALGLGLVNTVVPAEELDQAVDALVGELAELSPLVLSLGKESFGRALTMRREDALPYLAGMLTLHVRTDDAREGVTAFLQKRRPQWTGR